MQNCANYHKLAKIPAESCQYLHLFLQIFLRNYSKMFHSCSQPVFYRMHLIVSKKSSQFSTEVASWMEKKFHPPWNLLNKFHGGRGRRLSLPWHSSFAQEYRLLKVNFLKLSTQSLYDQQKIGGAAGTFPNTFLRTLNYKFKKE